MNIATATPRIESQKIFGQFSRFCLIEFRTRFNTTEWQVTDAYTANEEDGLPETIFQEEVKEVAIQKALALEVGSEYELESEQ